MQDDPFGQAEDEGEEPDAPENKAIHEIREAQKRAEKAAQKAERDRDALAAKVAEFEKRDREQQVSGLFTQVGLSPKDVRFFMADQKEGAEVNEEAVRRWAAENDRAPAAGQEGRAGAPATYVPSPVGATASTEHTMVPIKYFDDLSRTDPERAAAEYLAAVKQGRITFDFDQANEAARELRQ